MAMQKQLFLLQAKTNTVNSTVKVLEISEETHGKIEELERLLAQEKQETQQLKEKLSKYASEPASTKINSLKSENINLIKRLEEAESLLLKYQSVTLPQTTATKLKQYEIQVNTLQAQLRDRNEMILTNEQLIEEYDGMIRESKIKIEKAKKLIREKDEKIKSLSNSSIPTIAKNSLLIIPSKVEEFCNKLIHKTFHSFNLIVNKKIIRIYPALYGLIKLVFFCMHSFKYCLPSSEVLGLKIVKLSQVLENFKAKYLISRKNNQQLQEANQDLTNKIVKLQMQIEDLKDQKAMKVSGKLHTEIVSSSSEVLSRHMSLPKIDSKQETVLSHMRGLMLRCVEMIPFNQIQNLEPLLEALYGVMDLKKEEKAKLVERRKKLLKRKQITNFLEE